MVGQKEIPTKRGEWPSTGDPPFTETLVQTVYLSLSKSLRLAHVDTIVTMRRLVFVVVVVLVVGGATWAQWPSTVWPRAFCAPVVRVVAADARAIVTYQTNNENLPITPAEHKMFATLRADIGLAVAVAPTTQLQMELRLYYSRLNGNPSMNVVTDAMSQFDQRARTQLRAGGVIPGGS